MMNNADLERAYREFAGNGHASALRAIYTLGYDKAAGITIDGNAGDQAKAQAAPTSAEISQLAKHPQIKKPD
jgi:hypothetical protein